MSTTILSTWVGVREAAAILGCSEACVRSDAKAGVLPARKIGKRRFEFHRADLERLVAGGLGAAQGASAFDAKAVARELRIMELESRVRRDSAELRELRSEKL